MPLPTFAGTPTLDQLAASAPPTAPAAAPLSFLDKVKLGYKRGAAQPDWGWNQHNYEVGAYHDIRSALEAKGYKLPPTPFLSTSDEQDFYAAGYHPDSPWLAGPGSKGRFDALWQAFGDARSKDPGFLPGYKDVHDFGTLLDHVHGQRSTDLTDVATRAPDGLGLGGLTGQVGRGALDPVSWLPIGGPALEASSIGGRILGHALTGAAINAGITTASEPLVERDAAAIGQQRTTGDFVGDLLASTAFGGILGGTIGGAGVAKDALTEAFARRNSARVAGAAPPLDHEVAQLFSETVPPEQRTPDEQAAIHAVNRDAEVKAVSPFVPGPEGDDTHAQWLDQAMHTLHNPDQVPPRGPLKPIDRSTVTGPDDVEGARFPARETVKAMIHRAEGDGKNRAGGNAEGPYQFEPSTWISLFRRRYPGDQRSSVEIAGLREDPHLNDVLMNDLVSENAAALRHAGFEETAGNLYLAHVLGHDRAVTVLRANPDAKLGELLPHGYFKGNPFRETDSAASLVHWAYGKMGDKNALPLHLNTPEIAQGSEAIGAGEGDPEVQMSTGRFDVEALYGDVGMTDRPVLKPELFDSPEQHAAGQLRFERTRDAADGFAPVMSREEAFSPAEHLDAVKGYRGTVTADAMAEALGLSPAEVKRVVASMQSTDPKSPFMLSKGRQPKFDDTGNEVRPGTEPGRIIRRPPNPLTNRVETMLEYLTRSGGGLKDVGGDIASMGGHDWHKEAPFRRKLIDNENGQSLDDAFSRAIDEGYFPEHNGTRLDGNTDLPDIQDFHDAIDAELRGNPRHLPEDYGAVERAKLEQSYAPEEDQAAAEAAALPRIMTPEEISTHVDYADYEKVLHRTQDRELGPMDDDVLVEAAQRWAEGENIDDAIDHALMAAAARELDKYAEMAGEMGYGVGDEWLSYVEGTPEVRDGEPADPEDGAGGGRSAPAEVGADESRAALEAAAHDPAAGKFSDPVGPAAEAQADSFVHDLQMSDDGGDYRLDEEGGETDLKSILDEIDEAQKAAAEMRNCLKPKGGDE